MVKFYSLLDFPVIEKFFNQRGVTDLDKSLMPELGIIADDVACGFMYIAENKVGILEWYACDKNLTPQERERYFDLITYGLIDIARSKGLKLIICNTDYKILKKIAGDMGFKSLGQISCFSKEL